MDLKLCIKILQILWQKPFVSWILGWRNYCMCAHVRMFLCSMLVSLRFYAHASLLLLPKYFRCSCLYVSMLVPIYFYIQTYSMLASLYLYASVHMFLCSNFFLCSFLYVSMLEHIIWQSVFMLLSVLYSCLYISLPSMTCTTVWSLWVNKIRSSNSMTCFLWAN